MAEQTTDAKLLAEYDDIAATIDNEGLGYAIWPGGYLNEGSTSDPDLAQAFVDARKALQTIQRIMKPYAY